ncbi:MAG: peptidylprolyl isomerase [Flavobacteriales bacterium]|nr:peptidylprolyl isomerase [Flavobacteriales bacterium]
MRTTLTAIVIGLLMVACDPYKRVVRQNHLGDGLYGVIETNRGTFCIRLEHEKAPLTVASFVGLAEGTIENKVRKQGEPYFDGLTFHRVVPDFVIQGGDPLGDGRGGPGYNFRQEIHPTLKHDSAGVVAMANAGPNTNGSQFYVTLKSTNFLDGSYNVFGSVVYGLDVIQKIQIGDRMEKVRIVRVGALAKAFDAPATFTKLK